MPSSIYTNTGIVEQSYNSRGLLNYNFNTKNLVRLDNGVLFAVVSENYYDQYDNIYVSKDNGFSWNRVWTGSHDRTAYSSSVSGTNYDGPVNNLTIDENRKLLFLWKGLFYFPGSTSTIVPFVFSYDSNYDLTYLSPDDNDWLAPQINTSQDTPAVAISNSGNHHYLTYVASGNLVVRAYQSTYLDQADGSANFGGNYFDIVANYANDDSSVDMLAVANNGSTMDVVYLQWNRLYGLQVTPVILGSYPLSGIGELSIARDGWGNICAIWSVNTQGNSGVDEYYSLSSNNGVSWIDAQTIKHTSSQTDYIDAITNVPKSRCSVLAGLQGFMLTYTRRLNEKSIGYVRKLVSSDGDLYTLEEERIAASSLTEDVAGVKFFLPTGSGKVDLNSADQIRIGYQIGLGDSPGQVDKQPVYVGQKLLLDEAYPEVTQANRLIDNPLNTELICDFNLLGSTYQNVDYYKEGLIGNITSKYISAFNRFGTSIDIKRYEPTPDSVLDDRSAYSLVEQIYVEAFIDDVNYSYPVVSGNETFEQYIERDTRTVHLPPNLHLGRQFIINNGNKLKRTVWIMTHAGNEYELTQLVPKFIDNQIAYYTINAYVVGPSRNPFSRTILPSET